MKYPEAMRALLTRRSVSVKDMTSPAPTDAELEQILTASVRVPDHGKLTPWKIIVLKEPRAQKLGTLAAGVFKAKYPDAAEDKLLAERQRFLRAPLCIAVLSTPKIGTKPVWEQELSAGAVCTTMLHAIHALGYGAKWLSEWVAYEPAVIKALGGAEGDKIAGFIYIGTKTEEPEDRARPSLGDIVEWR